MLGERQYGPFLSTGTEGCHLVPSYARNLVSVKRLTDKGAAIHVNDDPTIEMSNRTVG